MKPGVTRVFRNYLKNTSLHGVKYILAPYCFDRVWWVCWCVAGAACAGGLCNVLWGRFVGKPALLVRRPLELSVYQPMPRVAVCPTPDYVTQLFLHHLSIKTSSKTTWLPALMGRILNAKSAEESQMLILDQQLVANNLTLSAALMAFMPSCEDLLTRCRWQDVMLPCNQLFAKEITPWGVCCNMRSDELPEEILERVVNTVKLNQELELVMQCPNPTTPYGCRFFTKYHGEIYIEPTYLASGSAYLAQLTFLLVQDEDPEKVVDGRCVSWSGYSRRRCLTMCKEKICGCSSPLNDGQYYNPPPECSAVRMRCLLEFNNYNNPCGCAPSCRQVASDMYIESIPLDATHYAYDPIYAGLNETSIFLKIIVRVASSKVFYSKPSETWLTLMSSIGGAFSVFLGVGFLSALEIIFYFLIKLPVAIFKSAEDQKPVKTISVNERQAKKGINNQ